MKIVKNHPVQYQIIVLTGNIWLWDSEPPELLALPTAGACLPGGPQWPQIRLPSSYPLCSVCRGNSGPGWWSLLRGQLGDDKVFWLIYILNIDVFVLGKSMKMGTWNSTSFPIWMRKGEGPALLKISSRPLFTSTCWAWSRPSPTPQRRTASPWWGSPRLWETTSGTTSGTTQRSLTASYYNGF